MELDRYTDRVRTQLAAVADTGSDDVRSLAERMSAALDPAIRLALLELLSEAAGEISGDLAPGSVDVRLRGRDPELVVHRPAETPAAPAPAPAPPAPSVEPTGEDDAATFRTTLRLPERLKSRVEQAATTDGVSVNTWLVRAVTAALEPAPPRPASRSGDRFTGWVR